jgi:hypothetical protein
MALQELRKDGRDEEAWVRAGGQNDGALMRQVSEIIRRLFYYTPMSFMARLTILYAAF